MRMHVARQRQPQRRARRMDRLGSGTRPSAAICAAMSSSPGRRSASARKAGSRLSSRTSTPQRPGSGRGRARPRPATIAHQRILGQRPPRLPPVERVGVMRQKEGPLGRRNARAPAPPAPKSRAGSTAIGPRRQTVESERSALASVSSSTRGRHDLVAVGVQEAHRDRDDLGLLVGLARRWRVVWVEGQACRCRPVLRRQSSDTFSRGVPASEYQRLNWRQVAARRILETPAANPRSSPPRRRGGRNRGPAPGHSRHRPPAASACR